jgi:hypothetical protein
MEDTICPNCRHAIYKQENIDQESGRPQPREGDICICMDCGQPSVFDERKALRLMTKKELEKLEKKSPSLYFTVVKTQYEVASRIRLINHY